MRNAWRWAITQCTRCAICVLRDARRELHARENVRYELCEQRVVVRNLSAAEVQADPEIASRCSGLSKLSFRACTCRDLGACVVDVGQSDTGETVSPRDAPCFDQEAVAELFHGASGAEAEWLALYFTSLPLQTRQRPSPFRGM